MKIPYISLNVTVTTTDGCSTAHTYSLTGEYKEIVARALDITGHVLDVLNGSLPILILANPGMLYPKAHIVRVAIEIPEEGSESKTMEDIMAKTQIRMGFLK